MPRGTTENCDGHARQRPCGRLLLAIWSPQNGTADVRHDAFAHHCWRLTLGGHDRRQSAPTEITAAFVPVSRLALMSSRQRIGADIPVEAHCSRNQEPGIRVHSIRLLEHPSFRRIRGPKEAAERQGGVADSEAPRAAVERRLQMRAPCVQNHGGTAALRSFSPAAARDPAKAPRRRRGNQETADPCIDSADRSALG
jgi:hypothetical protein